MRHNRRTRRLGRNFSKRKALLDNLVISLLTYQAIKTTLPKAKEAQRVADHVINLGKTDTLAARRQVFSYLQNHKLTSELFKKVAPRFKSRKGGYTRVILLNKRKGDNAQLALLELTEKEIKAKAVKKPKKGPAKDEKGKAGRVGTEGAHETGKEAEGKEGTGKFEAELEKGAHLPKHPTPKKEKPKGEFLKNLGKFFRNKGFGNKAG